MSIWSACPDTCRAWSSRLGMIADVVPAFCGEHCLGKVMATEFIHINLFPSLAWGSELTRKYKVPTIRHDGFQTMYVQQIVIGFQSLI